jgi:predicted AlkP superfamily pyrophosphatase or phosphodiesterase
MSVLGRVVAVVLACLCAFATHAAEPPRASKPPLILVSIDGFRADYFDRGLTPTIAALAADGVRAREGIRPSFPTLTFPNHYTLVTGLYPDHHGIVDNTMDDARIRPDPHFAMSNYAAVADGRWWSEAKPLWVTAKEQGLRTGTMFWPGSEARIARLRPDHWAHFDAAIKSDRRVDIVLDWLDEPADKRPEFITLYFDQVDHQGHWFGPESAEVNQALREVDRAIARLVEGLEHRGLYDSANLVIVADHGMAATSLERVVYLDELAPNGALTFLTGGPTASMRANTPAGARAVLGRHPHMTCWRKAALPPRFHYGANRRVAPIICLADAGWVMTTYAYRDTHRFSVGEHGYDNADPAMRALFVAHGPAFRRGVLFPVFDNVDVYPLQAHVLGVRPERNDGALAPVAGLLSAPAAPPS